eukprot:5734600-Alexandrium_andersonii.AAC.1
MSASLVGSEMCIRDRGGGDEDRDVVLPVEDSWISGMSMDLMVRPPMADAVSYTHLTLPTICSV